MKEEKTLTAKVDTFQIAYDSHMKTLKDLNIIACTAPPNNPNSCIPGTQLVRLSLTKRATVHPSPTKNEVFCRMFFDARFDLCTSCCCNRGIGLVTVNSELSALGSQPNHMCKQWFGLWDAIIRAMFGFFKSLKIVENFNQMGCLLEREKTG